jgi:hypothetical protein
MAFIRLRSRTTPPRLRQYPAALCPPPRTVIGSSRYLAKSIVRATSAAERARTTNAGGVRVRPLSIETARA